MHHGSPMNDLSAVGDDHDRANADSDSNSNSNSNLASRSRDVSHGSNDDHNSSHSTNSSDYGNDLTGWELLTLNGLGASTAASLAESALEPEATQTANSDATRPLKASRGDESGYASDGGNEEDGDENGEDDDDDDDENEDSIDVSINDDPLLEPLLEFVGPAVLAPLVLDRAVSNGHKHSVGSCGALSAPFVLLYGDAGVGKSTLVASLAHRLGSPPQLQLPSQQLQQHERFEKQQQQNALLLPAFPAVACEWVACSDLIGATMPHVLDVLEKACQNAASRAPCLLVLDDLDLLVPNDSGMFFFI